MLNRRLKAGKISASIIALSLLAGSAQLGSLSIDSWGSIRTIEAADVSASSGPRMCDSQDPRITCMVNTLSNAVGKPVYPDVTRQQADGKFLLYWYSGDEVIPRPVFMNAAASCNLAPLQPGNFDDNTLRSAVRSITDRPQAVAVTQSCTSANIGNYQSAGHAISADHDCNEPFLVYEVNSADGSAFNGIRDKGSDVPNQAEAVICNPEGAASSSSSAPSLTQCNDGIDNDGDGATDGADFSCSSPSDNDETNPKSQCQDGYDNDGDGKTDHPEDPGCSSLQDNDEFNQAASSSSAGGANNCNSQDPRVLCMVNTLSNALGRSVYPDAARTQPDGNILYYWYSGDETIPRGTFMSAVASCGFSPLQPGNFNDNSLRSAVGSITDNHQAVIVANACTTQNIAQYQSAGHVISADHDCNEQHLVYELNSADGSAFNGIRDKGMQVPNQAEAAICHPEGGGTPSSSSSSSSSTPSGSPNLSIHKTTQQTSVRPGEPIFYTITVQNSGNATAQNVRMYDIIPYGTTYVPAGSTSGCVQATVNNVQVVQCSAFNLNANDSKSFTLKFMVNQNQLACGSQLRNQADIEANNAPLEWDDVFTTIQCDNSSSSSQGFTPQCSDGVDNNDPEDTVADTFDIGCYTNGIYNPNDNDETNAGVSSSSSSSSSSSNGFTPQCSDGVDNNDPEDTVADTFDIGCYTNGIYNPNDNDETNPGISSSSSSSSSSQGGGNQTDIIIQKTGNSTVNQGGEIVYTLTVTNVSSINADQVVVTDIIPAGTFFVTSNGASCAQNTATTVACTLGTIHGGQSRTFTLTFQTFNGVQCNSSITNYATVSTVTPESNSNNNVSQTVSTYVQCNGSSSSSGNNGCIEVIKYAYDTNGNQLNVVPQFTFTLDGNRTALNASNGRTRFDNVSNGTHTVIESVPSGWVLQNVSPSNGTVNVNGSSCAQVVFQNRQTSFSSTTFTVDISDDESEVEAGDSLEYTIKVRNTSNQQISGMTLTATMDDEVNIEDVSNGGDDNGRIVTWNNLSFDANEQKTFHVEVEVDNDADGTLRASAQILSFSDSDSTDVDDVDSDEDEDDDDHDDDAEIDLSKESNTSEVFPGGIVEYTLRIRNTGDTDLEDITVEDRLPSGITIIDDGDADSRSGNRLVWEIDRLDEGKTWTVRYRVSVNAYLTPGTVLRNSVVVTSDDDEIDEAEGVTVAVIGNMPQTGYGNRRTGMLLSPITHRDSSAGLPLTVLLSMLGMGTGAGLGLGRKYVLGF